MAPFPVRQIVMPPQVRLAGVALGLLNSAGKQDPCTQPHNVQGINAALVKSAYNLPKKLPTPPEPSGELQSVYRADAGVMQGYSRLKDLVSQYNALPRGALSGCAWGRQRGMSAYDYYKEIESYAQKAKSLLAAIEQQRKVYKDAKEGALARATRAIIYKGWVIKGVAEGGELRYLVVKEGTDLRRGPFGTLDAAKSSIDQEIAAEQQEEVDEWTRRRIEQEGQQREFTPLPSEPMPQQPSTGWPPRRTDLPSGRPPSDQGQQAVAKKGNMGRNLLLAGGAAAAAWMLMK